MSVCTESKRVCQFLLPGVLNSCLYGGTSSACSLHSEANTSAHACALHWCLKHCTSTRCYHHCFKLLQKAHWTIRHACLINMSSTTFHVPTMSIHHAVRPQWAHAAGQHQSWQHNQG
jgi:hypothetical protein